MTLGFLVPAPGTRLHFKLFLIVISAATLAPHFRSKVLARWSACGTWSCQRQRQRQSPGHLWQSKYLCHGQLINRKQASEPAAAGRALVHN